MNNSKETKGLTRVTTSAPCGPLAFLVDNPERANFWLEMFKNEYRLLPSTITNDKDKYVDKVRCYLNINGIHAECIPFVFGEH